MIGPPLPGGFLQEEDDDGGMVGPPRQAAAVYDDDGGVMIGPPCPQPGASGSQDSDDDSNDGMEENSHRILMINEIVLKGHSKIWNIVAGWSSKPDVYVQKGHEDEITGLKFSIDGQILLSRSSDNTLKIRDLGNIKFPLEVFDDLPNHYAQTNAAFSPDEQLFLTGTSIERESTIGGLLCLFDRKKLELVSRVGISPKSLTIALSAVLGIQS